MISHHGTHIVVASCHIVSHLSSIRIPMNSAGRYRETVENWSKAYLDTVEQARPESRNLVLVGDREGL